MTLATKTIRVVEIPEGPRLTVSPTGEIRAANDPAHRLLGYPAGSLVGLSLAWLAPPSRHDVLRKLAVALERSTPLCVECVFMREDGEMLHVDLTLRARLGGSGGERLIAVEIEEDSEGAPRLQSRSVPRFSDVAPKPPAPRETARDQLSTCMQLLTWLESHISDSSPEDLTRERERLRVVLRDAHEMLESAVADLDANGSGRPVLWGVR
jgi:PAS domain S-box-containing protein